MGLAETFGPVLRDFFLFTALKEGDKLEQPGGIQGKAKEWRHSGEEFQRWCQGRTGFPFVDACMRELAATGYMSNRGRQNVSSFLCKVLQNIWSVPANKMGHTFPLQQLRRMHTLSYLAHCLLVSLEEPSFGLTAMFTCAGDGAQLATWRSSFRVAACGS